MGAAPHLLPGLLADDGLEVAHHHGVWVGAGGRPQDVVRVLNIGDLHTCVARWCCSMCGQVVLEPPERPANAPAGRVHGLSGQKG